ncbi:ATP-binding cassette domain-containing protein, partial [Rhizobium ruizarguesonis]
HSLSATISLPHLRKWYPRGFLVGGRERREAEQAITRLGIKAAGPLASIWSLSGGNQQKVALAKWLPLDPSVLLLNDPTRGVDIETKREIYLMLRAFAAEGRLVILASSDTPELVHLCDRVVV